MATSTIYFVTENFLKTYGLITDNADVTDFSPVVQFAAKAFVKHQVGAHFFDDLLAKYNAQTLSELEELVVEKMQWAICWRATAHAGVSLTYQLKNIGYQKQSDANSESADLDETKFLYQHYVQQALLFEAELRDFLLTHKDDYPEFLSESNKDSSIRNSCNPDSFNEGVGLILI